MNRDGILTSYIGTTDNDDFDEKQIQIHDEDVECDFDQEIAAVALGDGEVCLLNAHYSFFYYSCSCTGSRVSITQKKISSRSLCGVAPRTPGHTVALPTSFH